MSRALPIAIGDQFGKWTVIALMPYQETPSHNRQVKCRCLCGAEHRVNLNNLRRGKSTQCLVCKNESYARSNYVEIHVGDQFGKRTVIDVQPLTVPDEKCHYVACQCSCGKIDIVPATMLRQGIGHACTKCKNPSALRHGHSSHRTITRTWRAWSEMKRRCENPHTKAWQWYGGNGVTVCARWHQFESFLEDMGVHPGPGYSLDRMDHDKGYEPGNCRWATVAMQHRNMSSNRLLTLDGITQPLCDWAEAKGLNAGTIRSRLRYGWSVERALMTPVDSRISEGRKRQLLARIA